MWVDYGGAKGYVAPPPPLKLLGGLPPPLPPALFLRLWVEESAGEVMK